MSAPAPPARAVAALVAHELRLTARRGENVLVTLVIPLAVLLFFGGTAVLPGTPGERLARLVPGTVALAIVAAGLVSLGIATAYERSYGVLKRLGGAPLPRWGLLAAKAVAVLVLEAVQVVLILATAFIVLGWRPGPDASPLLLVGGVALGTIVFTALGLLLAGALRAEAVLALANGLFVAVLMLGGVILPVADLPAVLQPIATLLPSTSLAELLGIALGVSSADPIPHLALLVAWGSAAALLAVRTFRWD